MDRFPCTTLISSRIGKRKDHAEEPPCISIGNKLFKIFRFFCQFHRC